MESQYVNFWVTDTNVWTNAAFLDPKKYREYHKKLMKKIDEHNKKKKKRIK